MLSLKSITEGHDRLMVHPSALAYFQVPTLADRICLYFHCAFRFSTLRLAYMLDSLVRVSRRVWWAHLNSESRSLKSNKQPMYTSRKGTSEEVPTRQCNMNHLHRSGKCRDPSFLRQTSVFTLWNVIHRSEDYPDTALSRSSNAFRGPDQHSAPNLASRTHVGRFYTGKTTQAFNKFELRCRPYETLHTSGSLSTVSRTFSLSLQSSFHLSLTVLVRYRSRVNI